jgi:tetratricopeptide (TPR) repeat protein
MALVAVALALAAPAPLLAEEAAAPLRRSQLALEIDQCPEPPTSSEAVRRAAAGEHYNRGDVLYVQGDYEGASSEFIAAYCLVPYYTVLKDIGQSYERLLNFEKAIAYFERYVAAVPNDAVRLDACKPEPAKDKQNVSSRILVLSALAARVRVTTHPGGARVTLTGEAGLAARGLSGGDVIEARAGNYELAVELEGFAPVRETVTLQVGQPYSYYFALTPLQGQLRVRTVPGDARIFIDHRLAGVGTYQQQMDRGKYRIDVEASEFQDDSREVEVVADESTEVTLKLRPKPSTGRGQLVAAAGVFGGFIGGSTLGNALGSTEASAAGGLGGAAIAVAGSYFGIPDDISAGRSSLIITTSLVGAAEGALAARLRTEDEVVVLTSASLGLVVGGAAGALISSRVDLEPGQAALLNSGAVWGTVLGALFGQVFESDTRVESGLALVGLNAGVLTGALLARSQRVSRRHVALVDLAALAGTAIALTTQEILDADSVTRAERRAHFGIGGIAVGLIAGAYLTRNMDARRAPQLTPTVSSGAGGSSWLIGIAARW